MRRYFVPGLVALVASTIYVQASTPAPPQAQQPFRKLEYSRIGPWEVAAIGNDEKVNHCALARGTSSPERGSDVCLVHPAVERRDQRTGFEALTSAAGMFICMSLRATTPPFITKRTRSISLMSWSGLPETAMMSANLPFSTEPMSCSQP